VLTDWIHWLSSRHRDQLLSFLWALFAIDGSRYALGKLVMCLVDCVRSLWRHATGRPEHPGYNYCPSVCVILAGHNEAETIGATLATTWGSYPRLDIVVVDDGSTDEMAAVARSFAKTHAGVLVLSRPERGGKSSAMNWGLQYTKAEIVIVVDADSDLEPGAIWEIVQPLSDPQVGAVAGCVLARNPFVNLCTWLQAYEYLSSIFVGRLLAVRCGILGIVSGAFGAFRRSTLDRSMGWDVGPPEDLDLTLTIRKAGQKIEFAPYAQCYTDLPTTWKALVRQRIRWEQSGVVRNHCRKHLDLAAFWHANFRWGNLGLVLESWLFNILCMVGIWIWIVHFAMHWDAESWKTLVTLYLCYVTFEVVQAATILYYTNELKRDAMLCLVFPLVVFYQLLLLVVRLVATLREFFGRMSFEDNYVPLKVRRSTWHW
jgi:biofilm PGA synthesis N-glycosyltransferase PgaC